MWESANLKLWSLLLAWLVVDRIFAIPEISTVCLEWVYARSFLRTSFKSRHLVSNHDRSSFQYWVLLVFCLDVCSRSRGLIRICAYYNVWPASTVEVYENNRKWKTRKHPEKDCLETRRILGHVMKGSGNRLCWTNSASYIVGESSNSRFARKHDHSLDAANLPTKGRGIHNNRSVESYVWRAHHR
jgi:hypothetical protein